MKLDPSAFVAENELIAALLARSTPVDCQQDRILFRQGDMPSGLYIFCAGHVLMTMHSPEGELVMEMPAEPGSLLGLPGLVGNGAYSLSALVRKGSQVRFVSREEFSSLMLSESRLAVMILRVLAAEVRTARLAAVSR